MARFDVYPTAIAEDRKHTPFWLDVQADHLDGLGTRVVLPLRRVARERLFTERLSPRFTIEGIEVFADVANVATFPTALLRRPVASLRHERMAIEDALDFLFTGI